MGLSNAMKKAAESVGEQIKNMTSKESGEKETTKKESEETAKESCKGKSNPKTPRETPAVLTKGDLDRSVEKNAKCIASSFEGITRIGATKNERCTARGGYESKQEAYKKTDGKCSGHNDGKGTGSVSLHASGKALDAYVTALDKKRLPAARTEDWPEDAAELKAGDRLKDWAIQHRRDLNIERVIWNKKSYSAENKWEGEDYKGPDKHLNHVHLEVE